MRLTLRTLLAYLDDTLEPAQAKLIGQKVAESDAAQELVARIKQVTRRRRLTTPPAGPGAKTDPNMIAEYLDNTLPSEQLAEVEEICLASDVHLAEIAACHQILTLVLGEPALVPPTARQRMYALVKGPEAIPFRKPSATVDNGLDALADDAPETDETLRLGLPAYHRQGAWTQRLALVGGALALVALLVVAIWQVLPPSQQGTETNDHAAAGTDKANDKKELQPTPPMVKKNDKDSRPADKDARPGKQVPKKVSDKPRKDNKRVANTDKRARDRKPNDKSRDKGNKDKSAPPKLEQGTIAPDQPIPATEPRVVGRYAPPPAREAPAVLLRRGKDQQEWQRLEGNTTEVSTGDTLVSLPGYRSQVRLQNGLDLVLWGDLPEVSMISPLLESVVTIHDPAKFDLDLTLDRGRVVIANPKKAPARIRVRFANPTTTNGKDFWEITLPEKGTRVSLELWGRYPAEIPFSLNKKTRLGPEAELYLFVLNGQASATIDYTTQTMEEPPGPGMIVWKSKTAQASSPINIKQPPDWASSRGFPAFPPNMDKRLVTYLEGQRSAMLKGLSKLSIRMSGKKVKVGLIEALNSDNPIQRVLAVRCLGAINDLSDLLDGIVDEKYPEVRQAAIEDLRHWIGLHWENDLVLHDVLMKTKGYTRGQANTIMELLHSFSDRARGQPETYARLIDYLRQDKPAIRVLAHWHLVRMVPAGLKIPYDPLGDSDLIDKAYDAWKDLVPEGSLPKTPKQPMKK